MPLRYCDSYEEIEASKNNYCTQEVHMSFVMVIPYSARDTPVKLQNFSELTRALCRRRNDARI